MTTTVAVPIAHDHIWRIAEVEFLDSQVVDRYECACGAIDFVYR